MNETPLTDEKSKSLHGNYAYCFGVLEEFTRQMERELQTAKSLAAAQQEFIEKQREVLHKFPVREQPTTVKEAREFIANAFQADPDFRRTYLDNIACAIMDEMPTVMWTKEKRDASAAAILKRIFE